MINTDFETQPFSAASELLLKCLPASEPAQTYLLSEPFEDQSLLSASLEPTSDEGPHMAACCSFGYDYACLKRRPPPPHLFFWHCERDNWFFSPQSKLVMEGFRSLKEGEQVEFTYKKSSKGLESLRVTGPGGGPCAGSERRPKGKVPLQKRKPKGDR